MIEPLLDQFALAQVLGLSPKTVRHMASQSPERLPPRVRALTLLRWDPADVKVWLEQQSEAPRKAGRPRKQ